MNESKQRKVGAVLSYVVLFLNILISILYTPFLTGRLGQSEYGLYSMINNIISYLTILDFGFASAIIVYTARYKAKKEQNKEYNLYGMFLIIYTIIGVLVTLISIILYFNIENLFNDTMSIFEINTAKKLMIILTINLVFTFPFSIFPSIVNAYEKFIFAKIINIIVLIIKPLITIPLLFIGYKSIALALVITIVNLSSLVINMIYCLKKLKIKIRFNSMDFKLLFEVMGFSFWIFLNSIVDKINWNVDSFLLGTLSGTIAVSVYSIASQINTLYISFSTAISGILLPVVTKMVNVGATNEEFTDILIKTGRIQLMIVGLILCGFIIFGKFFIELWVGKEYLDSYLIAIFLMFPMIVSLIQNSCTSIVQAKNKHNFMPIVLIFTSILNIIISIPLIKVYNGLGAAIGTGVSLLIGNIIIKNIYYYKVIKLDVIKFFKNVSNIAFFQIILLLISVTLIVIFNIKLQSWLQLVFGIFIFVVIYIIGILKLMNNYEKNMIKKVAFLLKRGVNNEE